MCNVPVHTGGEGKGELFVLSTDNLAYLTGLKSQFHKYLQVNYSRL